MPAISKVERYREQHERARRLLASAEQMLAEAAMRLIAEECTGYARAVLGDSDQEPNGAHILTGLITAEGVLHEDDVEELTDALWHLADDLRYSNVAYWRPFLAEPDGNDVLDLQKIRSELG